MAPLAWLDWLQPIVIGAAIGGSIMMILTGWRLWRLSSVLAGTEVP
jgi:hypothetical protein